MYCNSINCINCGSIFNRIWLYSFTNIPCTDIFDIECAFLLVSIHRTEPMPMEFNHTITVSITIKNDSSFNISVIPRRPIQMPWIMRRIILHIITSYHWIDTYSIFNLLRLILCISTNNMSTIGILYSLIKIYCFWWRIACN